MVRYDGSLGLHLLRFWDVWTKFDDLAKMADWGVVVYGVVVSIAEVIRLMVFFANSYIKAKDQERQDKEDVKLAVMLSAMSENMSFEDALEVVKEYRKRAEAGWAIPTSS